MYIPTEPVPEALQNACYVFDGDGNLVKATINGKSTYFLGKLYQKKLDGENITIQKYYSSGSAQIAGRTIEGTNDTLQWLLSDHLGSTSTTANADGKWNSTIQYSAFGEIRASSGITATEFRYTGQLRQAELGLYYYVARWYDPALAHFTQADTIVPNAGDSAAYDRYAYVKNNPVKYTDPSGHDVGCAGMDAGRCSGYGSYRYETLIKRTYTITPIIRYIYSEMMTNSKSEIVGNIRSSNQNALKKPDAYAAWAKQVDTGHEWDHKSKIRAGDYADGKKEEFQKAGSHKYRFDTWSNIHFGFVGKMAGFSDNELLDGAGLAQFGTDLGKWFKNPAKNPFPVPDTSVLGYRGYDPAEDRTTITIGIDLYSDFGADLQPADIIWEVESQSDSLIIDTTKTKK